MEAFWSLDVMFWSLFVIAGIVAEVMTRLERRRRRSTVVPPMPMPMPGRPRGGPVPSSPSSATSRVDDLAGAPRGHLRAVGGAGVRS